MYATRSATCCSPPLKSTTRSSHYLYTRKLSGGALLGQLHLSYTKKQLRLDSHVTRLMEIAFSGENSDDLIRWHMKCTTCCSSLLFMSS